MAPFRFVSDMIDDFAVMAAMPGMPAIPGHYTLTTH